MDERLYEEWRHAHADSVELITPRRAYLAGLSKGRESGSFPGAVVTRIQGLARRMRAVLNASPPPRTLAERRDIEELDRDLRDWIERPCQEWQNVEVSGGGAFPPSA